MSAKDGLDEDGGLPSVSNPEAYTSMHERFSLDNPGEMFEFIQKVAFPKMPLEMVAILVTHTDVALCERLSNAIWQRMDVEKKYATTKGKTQLVEYVLLLRQHLRFSTSYKGIAREQLMERAIAGMPREQERRTWFKKR